MWPFSTKNLNTSVQTHSDAELRLIWDSYSDNWPSNDEQYRCWKPDTILPASKDVIKRSLKLAYKEWEDPMEWTIFSAFFMQFVDLAHHLPSTSYEKIKTFREAYSESGISKYDPLMQFITPSSIVCALTDIECEQALITVRDSFSNSQFRRATNISDSAISEVRTILLESKVELMTLTEEWKYYLISIDRFAYVDDPI